MKPISLNFLFAALILVCGCQQKTEHDHHHEADTKDAIESGGNQELYNEVMKIHDEAMAKMDNIHSLKQALREKLAKAPDLSDAEKKETELIIIRLDSAGEEMMDWMHKFQPVPDSVGEEKARAYLEGEMEKIKRVREDILDAIKKAEEAKQ